ncbi:MAG TPA: N(4)-(beta-N-acetylglucosaminyl)-L-asparaginase [Thermomonas sp.]|nr:N(4)-(beta-N-acetylglucosaminyl)-L-asparaginase [Thermomonas sp.]
MNGKLSRRGFMQAGAGLAASGLLPVASAQAPAVRAGAVPPVVIASGNGHQYRNGGKLTCVETAFERIVAGKDVLDAVIAGVNIVELDPEDTSVGYGGLPNAEGVVQLDSCCMHGPLRRAGGVAALEGVRMPSKVARAVLHETDHHLLVGAGAQQFARKMGFAIEDDLNTETSRKLWLEWMRRVDPGHYLDPAARAQASLRAGQSMVRDGLIDPEHFYGTINCSGINAAGDLCGVTTTSGLAWKIPGRVGDSPILGAGLYVDNGVGAAGSTGRGEANLYNLTSYLIVENLRRGMHPKDAAIDGLRRIQSNTVEKRLLNPRGLPNFGISFYVLDKQGRHAGVSMYPGGKYAVCDANGGRQVAMEALLEGRPGA